MPTAAASKTASPLRQVWGRRGDFWTPVRQKGVSPRPDTSPWGGADRVAPLASYEVGVRQQALLARFSSASTPLRHGDIDLSRLDTLGYQAPVASLLESRVTLITLLGSGALSVALLMAYMLYDSQLAFAQFADSVLDLVTATVLAWTVRVSARPEDADHHFGHKRAQPVGGLVTAVLTAVLAVEIVQRAVAALLEGPSVEFDPFILWCFGTKIGFKSSIWLVTRRRSSRLHPAMSALAVDARNDVLTSSAAVLGFFAARQGAPQIDAWLALPLAAVIGWSGWQLASDNVRLLMGEAPPLERQQELLALARRVVGVRSASSLRVHYVGTELHADLEISVDSSLTIGQAHDIGEAVRQAVEAELDVSRCSVHIDPDGSRT